MKEERKETIIKLAFFIIVATLFASFFCSCQKDETEQSVPIGSGHAGLAIKFEIRMKIKKYL